MQSSDKTQLNPVTSGADEAITPEIVAEILTALRGLRYGSIVFTIHDSKVVQIEKNEKVRLQKKAGGKPR